MRPVKTVVIEPNGLLREGLKRILAETRFQPLRVCCSLDDLAEFPTGSREHLFILGTRDLHKALQHVARLREQTSTARIVALLESCNFEAALPDLLRAGANAVLSKSVSCALKSLDLVLFDESVFVCTTGLPEESLGDILQLHIPTGPPSVLTEPTQADPSGSFSDRELAILSCLEDGASNKVIARKLGITESTVKVHLKAIMRKLRVKNRTQTAIWAMRQSLNSPGPEALAAGSELANGGGNSNGAPLSLEESPHEA
jgi:two-component system nitrate/nitrite response regulator NarL